MRRLSFVLALLLLLGGAAFILYGAGTVSPGLLHPTPGDEMGEGPGIAAAEDCPTAPDNVADCPIFPDRDRSKGGRFTSAPDNAISGGAGGPPKAFTDLYRQLEQKIQERSLQVNLSLFDFETGVQIKINADRTFIPASLIKTLLLLAALEQAEQGKISLDDTHELSESDKYVGETRVDGTGTLQFAASGSVYALDELLTLMVSISDNVATNILFDRIGPKHMQALAKKLGLTKTAFTRKMYDHQSSLPLNRATASELTRLLVALEEKEAVGAKLSERGIEMMRETGDKRIGRYIGQYTDVANKVGTDSDLVGDMALIYSGGKPLLALTIVVENPPGLDESIDFIGELAALIVEQLLRMK